MSATAERRILLVGGTSEIGLVGAATSRALKHGDKTIWVPGVLRYVFAVVRHLPRAVYRRMPF